MKKLFKILLIALIFGVQSAAFAFVIQKPELERMIEAEVKAQTLREMQKYGISEVSVKVINLPVDDIVTKTAQKPEIKISSNFDKFLTYDIKKVVFIEEDKIIKTVPVNVRTFVYKDVVVAQTRIAPLALVNLSNTKIKRMEVGIYAKQVVDKIDPNCPYLATKPIMQDGLILKTSIKKKPDIVKNTSVKIKFIQNGNFNIEVDGIAEAEGNIGDLITVKNTRYNKVHTAIITGPNTVEVKL